ncbi:uncharacterized protein LOC134211146 isoform X2 [Armigeres subalbatus]|uniref:uncharacterized protein LOC134211146 isoform X2 n=1 Tax=Armigeres subalbatus TaxID=124917 RepID=UPI002ED1671A
MIKNCRVCNQYKDCQRCEPMQSTEVPEHPFQIVSMDLGELTHEARKKILLVSVDHFSNYFEVDFLCSQRTTELIDHCKKNFSRMGIPRKIITKSAQQFLSQEWKQFMTDYGISHVTSAPYHHESNGKAESAIKIAKNIIKNALQDKKDIWLAILDWRNTPQLDGYTPSQKAMGRRTRGILPVASDQLQIRAVDTKRVRNNIELRKVKSKFYHDRKSQELPKLMMGQAVFVQLKPEKTPEWTRGKIMELLSDRDYQVLANGGSYRRNRKFIRDAYSTVQQQEPTHQESSGRSIASPSAFYSMAEDSWNPISSTPKPVDRISKESEELSTQSLAQQHTTMRPATPIPLGETDRPRRTSTTGTFVNDQKFCKEHPGSRVLCEGDLIGIGTPCFQDESFYRENSHVLLFQVCKDRNRIVREGEVEVILCSDDEPEDIKVFDLEIPPEQNQTPAPVSAPEMVAECRDERLFRIVDRIDLSSDDDEGLHVLESCDRRIRIEESVAKSTEIAINELEQQKHIKEEQANKENRHYEKSGIDELLNKQIQKASKPKEDDKIQTEKTSKTKDNGRKRSYEAESSSSRRHVNNGKDREKRKCSESSSNLNNHASDKDENHERRDVQNVESEQKNNGADVKAKHKKAETVTDQIDELFQDSYSCQSPEGSEAQSNIPLISLDDSDEAEDEVDFSEHGLTQSYYRRVKKEALEVESQEEEAEQEPLIVPQIKVENVSPKATPIISDDAPIYITDDDEDENYLEDSKRWFQRLSQKSSPLRNKQSSGDEVSPIIRVLPSEKPIELDEYGSRDLDIPDEILDILKEPEPKVSKPEVCMPGIEKLSSEDTNEEKNTGIEDADNFLDNFLQELDKTDKDSSIVVPNSHTSPAKTPSEVPRTPIKEKNSNSASNAWISKKVPFIEPHHIVKRRMSVSAASLNKKPPKIPKHSLAKKPEVTKEARKQKLKEISTKKSLGNEGDSKNSKTLTKPKVKFTPCNRGAFLTEQIPGPSKSLNRTDDAGREDVDDFICTQSTTLKNVPPIDDLIDIHITKAPKLTFNSVAKVSRVAQNAPAYKIPKRQPGIVQKPACESISSILENIPTPAASNSVSQPKPNILNFKQPVKYKPTSSNNPPTTPISRSSPHMRSILKSPGATISKSSSSKKVKWSANLVETRTFEIEDGNYMTVPTKLYKDNTDFFRDMSQESCQNEIIQDITSWNAEWFDNPSEAAICGNQALLPMVEEYADFEDYKRIVLPILKTELFYDILGQYVEVKKRAQEPIQMKVNQTRAQGRTFVMTCSVESNKKQSINNKDYVLIMCRDRDSGNTIRFPAVVTARRQQVQYSGENGLKFFHCTIETAKSPITQRIKDGHGEGYRILSLTQINLHMRQFHVLFNLKSSPLLENILSPKSNFYACNNDIDRRAYKGKEALNVQQGDILLSVFGQCLDMRRPHIMLIQGPPGTGKSRLISNLVLQLRRGMPDRQPKILVCAQSNTAVDVIVLKLMKLFRLLNKDERCNLLRTGSSSKVNHECRIVFLDDLARKHVDEQIRCRRLRDDDPIYEAYYLEVENLQKKINHLKNATNSKGILLKATQLTDELNELVERRDHIRQMLPEKLNDMDLHDKDRRGMEMHAKKQFVAKADVICTTLGSCGSLMDYTQSLRFDVCIIDEATQCTEIASFTPLQFDVRKLILVGDVKQLPPLVFGKECAEAGLKNSLFSRIAGSFVGTNLEGVKMLTTQYRMHPEILKWPNEYFYEGKLTSNQKATECDAFPFKPYTVFSLECQQNLTQMEHEIYNNEEIQFVQKLLCEIIQFCERHTTIAVITPYSRHKRECEKFLFARKITQVSVLSIDSVQGQEYDVVVISLARTIGTGFLDNPQRLNVALTRARKCLIMCGNFADLREANVWSELLRDAEQRKVLYHIEEDDEYDDVDTFVEKVMRHLRKSPSNDTVT